MSRPLTTVAAVRQHMQLSDAEDEQSALIEELIPPISDAIRAHCQQDFAEISDETYRFRYDGRGLVCLAPFSLRAIDEVKIDSDLDGGGTVVPSTHRRVMPVQPGERGYTHLRLQRYGVAQSVSGPDWREVSITGSWGWEEVPPSVKLAANIAVAYNLRTTSAWAGDEMGSDYSFSGSGRLLTGAALRLLAPYRRIQIGF